AALLARQRRPGVVRAERRDGGERRDGHQAPRIIWPQPRTTLPLTARLASHENQLIVSATSTGRPPCARAWVRRPISRVACGLFSFISVSMKPGATSLTVTPCATTRGSVASLFVMPMTPALLAP